MRHIGDAVPRVFLLYCQIEQSSLRFHHYFIGVVGLDFVVEWSVAEKGLVSLDFEAGPQGLGDFVDADAACGCHLLGSCLGRGWIKGKLRL